MLVVIAPSPRARRGGGGVGKWTSVTPRGRKPIFHHPCRVWFGVDSGVKLALELGYLVQEQRAGRVPDEHSPIIEDDLLFGSRDA